MSDFDKTDSEDDEIALAGEYVLGTLDSEEQLAVKNSLDSNPLLKHWVSYWEAQLPKLYAGIPEQQPEQRVWQQIKQQIKQDRPIIYNWQKTPWWQGLALWRGLTVASVLGLVGLTTALQLQWFAPESPAITIVEKRVPVSAPDYVAVVRNDKTQAFWHISVYLPANHLFITALKQQDLPADKSYELWLLSKDKQIPPRSMGLMPVQGSQQLPLALSKAISQAAGLAVSLEPLGGSPTLVPTGPVVFQANLENVI